MWTSNKQSQTTKKRWLWVTFEPLSGRDPKANKLTEENGPKYANGAFKHVRVAVN